MNSFSKLEKEITREHNTIPGFDGNYALIELKNGQRNTYYVYTDHLGSTQVITDDAGNAIERHNFDAWGRERNPQTWQYTAQNPDGGWNPVRIETITDRGYTGHEMLPEFGIINMNGRLYDPVLGRMLSPDPFVQAPGNSQNYNRYSYVLNNPLKFTDPSGESWKKFWKNLGEIAIGFTFPVGSYTAIGGFIEALNNGAINPHLSKESRKSAWTKADLTMEGTKFNNSSDITQGLFAADTDRKGWFWQIASRLTIEGIQTGIGFTYQQRKNLSADGIDVQHVNGATVLSTRKPLIFTYAITFGSYITGQYLSDDQSTLEHEYGHYLQSQMSGPMYLFKYGIPIAVNNEGWYEDDATARGLAYNNGTYNRKDFNNTNPQWWDYALFLFIDPLRESHFNLKINP